MTANKKKKFRIPLKKISEFCRRWGVAEFLLFGSACVMISAILKSCGCQPF